MGSACCETPGAGLGLGLELGLKSGLEFGLCDGEREWSREVEALQELGGVWRSCEAGLLMEMKNRGWRTGK